jgi:dipeptidyl aminopeptidase/acylaminoacyl peptidase
MITSALFVSFALVAAPATPAAPAAPAPAKAAAPAKTAVPAKGAPSSSYTGLGAESVPPEVLQKFRAPPVDPNVSRRVQAMLDVRAPSAGILSPDGRRMFFTWGVTGVRQVWRLDGPMSFPVQLTGGEDATSVAAVTTDGKTLVIVRDRKGEENPGIYLQSAEGGPLTVVQHKPKVQTQPQHITGDGRWLYFRANDERPDAYTIYRYELATKKIERVFGASDATAAKVPGDNALWSLADRRDDAGVLLLVREVGSNQAEHWEFDEGKRALTPLFGIGQREDDVAAYGKGDTVLVLTPRFGEQRRLYRLDRTTQDDAKRFVPVSPELKWDVQSFEVDHAKQRVLLSVNEAGYSKPLVYDAATLKESRLPKLPAGDHVTFGATTRDGRRTTVTIDPGTAPAMSYVFDWSSWKLTPWHVPSAPEVDLSSFVKATLEEYPARDGTKIPMFVRRPKACTAEGGAAALAVPCPVVIDFHGGPEGQTRAGFSPRAQLFVDAGFVYVQPNVRGSDGYGKTWIHADDGAKRKNVITDIEDAAVFVRKAWASKSGTAPKVGIFGGSYGGYASLMGMTYFAGAYDAGVQVVGISSLITFLENTAPYRRALRISEYGDPVKDRDVLLELSPITHVQKAKGPMLMIQGATDPRVPVGEAIQVHEALAKKGLSQMIVFPDEGHGVQKRENNVVLLGHAIAFFEKQLKPTAPVAK